MQVFNAIAGQSIFDVCLNTYGTLDYLYKLMQDNGFVNINTSVSSGQPFSWDDSFVFNQALNVNYAANGIKYSTDVSGNGSVYYVSNGGDPFVPSYPVSGGPITPQTYQMVLNTSFTSNADGTTVITPTDINGSSIAGFDIVQIEKEIKPLLASQFIWNKATGVLTLVGNTCDNGESLFILYSKIVTA